VKLKSYHYRIGLIQLSYPFMIITFFSLWIEIWISLWSLFLQRHFFNIPIISNTITVSLCQCKWSICSREPHESLLWRTVWLGPIVCLICCVHCRLESTAHFLVFWCKWEWDFRQQPFCSCCF